MTFLRPLDDRVLVKKDPPEEKTSGGLYLPHTADDQTRGTVVAVGPGRTSTQGVRIPMELNVGNRVFYTKYSGSVVIRDGVDYACMHETDILAVVNDN